MKMNMFVNRVVSLSIHGTQGWHF